MLRLFRSFASRFQASEADVPFLFSHIPKTAGTSFRVALEQRYKTAVLKDYGAESDETSPLVKRHMYQESPDLYSFGRSIRGKRLVFIVGHVPIHKYLMLSRLDRVIMFFREPVQRVVSDWHMKCRAFGCKQSLESFVRDPQTQNIQSLLLGQAPIELIGFNLITEEYARSLEIFNAETGLDVGQINLNQNPSRTGGLYHLSQDDEDLIRELNQADVRLYNKVRSLFEQRINLAGSNWTYGGLDELTNREWITGFAYQHSLKPVEMELLVDGVAVGEAHAVEPRGDVGAMSVPRRSCIGFRFKLPIALSAGQIVTCRVKSTGQILGEVKWAQPVRQEKRAA